MSTADRPTTEPRTAAGRLLDSAPRLLNRNERRAAILAIEAEAAQGAAPRAEVTVGGCGYHVRNGICDVHGRHGAAPRAEGLDWPLVIEAVANTMPDGDTFAAPEVVAVEYARLSRPSDERVPESEEPR